MKPKPPSNITKQLTYIPPVDLDLVFGRDKDIQQLEEDIQAHPDKVILVNGMGAIGKTTLVKAWYKKYGGRYDYKAWVDVTSYIDKGFVESEELVSRLGLKEELKEVPEGSRFSVGFAKILGKLRELEGNNLLLVDNADAGLADPGIINRLADLLPGWTIIATSRIRHQFPPHIYSRELWFISEEDAFRLFRHYYPHITQDGMQELLVALAPHPFTLELAAKVLLVSNKVKSVRKLVEYLKERPINEDLQEAILKTANSDEERDIYMHLAKVFDLAEFESYEKWLLAQLAVLPPTPVKENHLQLLLQVPPEEHTKLNNTLQQLFNRGWLSGSLVERYFFLHRLLGWIIGFQAKVEAADCEQLVDSLYRIYETNDLSHFIPFFPVRHQEKLQNDYWLLKRYFDRLMPLDNILEHAVEGLPGLAEDETYFYLFRSLAHYQKEMGLFQEALENYKSYIDAAIDHGLDTVPFVIDAFRFIIETLLGQSSREALSVAEGYLEDMAEYVERHPGHQYGNRALFLFLEGSYLRTMGRYSKAQKSLEEALDILEGQIPQNERNIAAACNNLGLILQDLGDYQGARELLEKAMLSAEQNFEPQHPATAVRYSNLALVLQALGDYQGARELLEKAMLSDEQNFGPQHPATAVKYSNLAAVLNALGDNQGARELLEKAMLSDEQNFGPQHPATAVSYSNLASVLQDLGDY